MKALFKNASVCLDGTVKQLDMIIAACILVIIVVVAMELMDPGFTVIGKEIIPFFLDYSWGNGIIIQ